MSLTNATPLEVARAARLGSRRLAVLSTDERNAALTAIHNALAHGKEEVLAANKRDLEDANKAAAGGTLSQSLVKRLDLGKTGKYEDMLQGILDVRDLQDPSTSAQLSIPLCQSSPSAHHTSDPECKAVEYGGLNSRTVIPWLTDAS